MNIKIEQKYPKQRFYPHSMPVETSITAPSAILVLETVVETKPDDSRGRVPKTEPTEKLCLDLGAEMAFLKRLHL